MSDRSALPEWGDKAYSFFSHRRCEYFPCHPTGDPENFNCLFCYCPLYALGRACGGNFRYTEKGVKNCSRCTLPNRRESYGYIIAKLREMVRQMAEEERP